MDAARAAGGGPTNTSSTAASRATAAAAASGARVDADPTLKRQSRPRRTARALWTHPERQLGDRLGVISPWQRNAAGGHVGVPDRLDLLDAVVGGERIPACEHAVE